MKKNNVILLSLLNLLVVDIFTVEQHLQQQQLQQQQQQFQLQQQQQQQQQLNDDEHLKLQAEVINFTARLFGYSNLLSQQKVQFETFLTAQQQAFLLAVTKLRDEHKDLEKKNERLQKRLKKQRFKCEDDEGKESNNKSKEVEKSNNKEVFSLHKHYLDEDNKCPFYACEEKTFLNLNSYIKHLTDNHHCAVENGKNIPELMYKKVAYCYGCKQWDTDRQSRRGHKQCSKNVSIEKNKKDFKLAFLRSIKQQNPSLNLRKEYEKLLKENPYKIEESDEEESDQESDKEEQKINKKAKLAKSKKRKEYSDEEESDQESEEGQGDGAGEAE